MDAQGGVHAAFSGYSVDPNTSTYPVYYLYCAANCADPANWVWTRVGQVGMGASDCDGVRLGLDPQGRPRLMWYYLSSPLAAQGTWHYAECNANCTNAGSWADYAVVDVDPYRGFPGKGRYFALDPQGRPHFIYRDLTGTYYALCDGNCASGGQWRAFRLNESLHLYDASLAFSSSGMARLAYRTGNYLAYYEYVGDANYAVDPANSWSGGLFFTLGSEPMYSLRLDAQNRPRLAIYTNGRLSYAWCQSGCGTVGNWSTYSLGLPSEYGKDVDLAIDAQGRPHLAYNVDGAGSSSVYGLGYARCTGNCETTNSTWETIIVDDADHLDTVAPIPAKPGCQSSWLHVGLSPSLGIDAAGNARIAYNTQHYQGITCGLHMDVTLVRLAAIDGGGITPPPTRKPPIVPPTVVPKPTFQLTPVLTGTPPTPTRTQTPRPSPSGKTHIPMVLAGWRK